MYHKLSPLSERLASSYLFSLSISHSFIISFLSKWHCIHFFFIFPQSFPRWETDSMISCEQTLQKGEGPKTSWTREITNDGKLILVKCTDFPPSQSIDSTRLTQHCSLKTPNYSVISNKTIKTKPKKKRRKTWQFKVTKTNFGRYFK